MAIAIVRQLNEAQILDLCALYQNTWWAQGRTARDVRRMVANSDIVIGLHDDARDRLVGFARVLTDFVYRAVLFDLIVAESRQGLGFGRFLMDTIVTLPELQTVETIHLHCRPDMLPFYEKWGFLPSTADTVILCRPRSD